MLFPITAFAQAYVQTWDLVDSGKHLDYDGMEKVPRGCSASGWKTGSGGCPVGAFFVSFGRLKSLEQWN